MHVCLPSHVPTRHSSRPSAHPPSCVPAPSAEERPEWRDPSGDLIANASSAAPGDASRSTQARPHCAAVEPNAEPEGFSSRDHAPSSATKSPSASLRTTLPVAQRSFSHEISKRIDSNRTNSSMET